MLMLKSRKFSYFYPNKMNTGLGVFSRSDVSGNNMGRQITTLILVFWTLNSFGQTILFRPFVDDHKVFSYKDKSIGFMNLNKYDKAWQFTIDQFNSKTITVKQINDSLLNNCNDSIALTILKSWHRLSVDSISIIQLDNVDDITIGVNNIYNEDKSGISAIIFFKLLLFYDNKTKVKKVNQIRYLSILQNEN